ncbi:branched-chain amino acid transport system II carrier protein [Clostridium sp. MB40-C1]|uniref:branched-chain amino acid transport system II carrier protein n=1 Tax=Clostridium sp. MB40-C1 TaxID=3070996 RepID=UPI0027E1BE0F|nr:branched-chain amino acid transport system II carrier protein [Clostridium sp. MB40-C1]WMJ80916.1 branched-chain amino acid transport system II carrier protein [Clostridium sp. MB40-C1]
MNKKFKDFAIIGFALFAMFFGAGNLIFPPSLGKSVGSSYLLSAIGFIITGVGLPLLGIIACVKSGGSFEKMASKVNKPFAIIATTALILSIGPMLAIPRTAATTFELSIQPFFPSLSPFVAVLVYFLINLCFVLKPNSLIDNIGKFLTPILLLMLSLIIIKGFISPIGPIVSTGYKNVFSSSLLMGYQTMDAMASVIFASIIISSVKGKGYTSSKEVSSATIKSSFIAVIGLSFIYGGLLYLGSQTATLYGDNIPKTKLVMEISQRALGNFGAIALSISVGVACLTTSIGLIATASQFFTSLFKNKISYQLNAIIITVVSMIIALRGVDKIVALADPILQILYPIVIVLIISNLLTDFIKNNKIIEITVYVTLLISIISTISNMGIKISLFENLLKFVPLSSLGFAWVIPSLVAFVISFFVLNNKKNSINSEVGKVS